MKFEINLIFLIKPFFQHDKNILRTKGAFKMKEKLFFIIFKGLSMKQKTKVLWKVRVRLQASFIHKCKI